MQVNRKFLWRALCDGQQDDKKKLGCVNARRYLTAFIPSFSSANKLKGVLCGFLCSFCC